MKIKKQRIGVVGWLYAIDTKYGKTTAVCDIRQENIDRFKRGHAKFKAHGFTDYKKMVDSGLIDMVAIATPNQFHRDMAEYAMKKGLNVFLEKPMGVSRKELDSIYKTQQKTGQHLAIDFELRISFFAKRVKELIKKGEIGKPVSVEFLHHRGAWLAETKGVWRTDPKRSGGLYFMEVCHEVDVFRYWFGEISAVQSFSAPNVLPQYPKNMPDNVCTHFWFKNGVVGTILTNHTCSVYKSNKKQYDEHGHDMQFIIVGTKGAIRVDLITQKFLVCKYKEFHPDAKIGSRVELSRIEDYSSMRGNTFHHDCIGNLHLFIKAMAEGKKPHQDAGDARKTHLIGLAAEKSAIEKNQKIDVGPILKQK